MVSFWTQETCAAFSRTRRLTSLGRLAYCVRTATLVAPRVTPAESLNRTKTRFVAGSKGTVPVAMRKIANVGVLLVSICTVTLPLGAERQIPVEGFV